MKNVVQDLTSAGIDWQREKWQSGLGSKFIHLGEKNAVKYADEVIVLSKGVQDYFKETYLKRCMKLKLETKGFVKDIEIDAMKSNFDKVFSYNLDEVRKKNLVDMERLFNLLSVMNEQQIRLDTAVHGINSNGIERQRELNKGYLQELKAFLTDLNTLNRKNSHSDFIWKLR